MAEHQSRPPSRESVSNQAIKHFGELILDIVAFTPDSWLQILQFRKKKKK